MRDKIVAVIKMILTLSIMYITISGFSEESLIFAIISSIITTSILILNNAMINIGITKNGILYVINLLLDIVKSAFYVTRIIWTGRQISPTMKWIKLHHESNLTSISLQANSITMTPGTIVVAIYRSKMLIHAIDKMSIDSISSSNIPDPKEFSV